VTIERYLVAEDCGQALNPMIVEGQQHGAVALGLGGALRERVVYDGSGQNVTGSFADYAMSIASDLPLIDVQSFHSPSQRIPTGSKGMSEGGVMGAIGAASSALNDALAPFGIATARQPLSAPALFTLLHERAVRLHSAPSQPYFPANLKFGRIGWPLRLHIECHTTGGQNQPCLPYSAACSAWLYQFHLSFASMRS